MSTHYCVSPRHGASKAGSLRNVTLILPHRAACGSWTQSRHHTPTAQLHLLGGDCPRVTYKELQGHSRSSIPNRVVGSTGSRVYIGMK